MNPLLHLRPALYAALTSPALELAGAAVPVYEHLPEPYTGPYLLLQQPTLAKLPGTAGCKQWSCTVLLDLITQFPTALVSSTPVEQLLDQVCARLDDQRLPLPAPYDCGRATYEPTQAPETETDKEWLLVRRLIRFRWLVSHHAPTVVVPPAYSGVFDYVFSGPGGGFLLS